MLWELDNIYFYKMLYYIRKFVSFCATYRENGVTRKLVLGELQLILVYLRPFYTIALDFITDMLKVLSGGTMWAIPKHLQLNCLAIVFYIFSKKTILLAGHTIYIAEE